jgi:hypothetical protein
MDRTLRPTAHSGPNLHGNRHRHGAGASYAALAVPNITMALSIPDPSGAPLLARATFANSGGATTTTTIEWGEVPGGNPIVYIAGDDYVDGPTYHIDYGYSSNNVYSVSATAHNAAGDSNTATGTVNILTPSADFAAHTTSGNCLSAVDTGLPATNQPMWMSIWFKSATTNTCGVMGMAGNAFRLQAVGGGITLSGGGGAQDIEGPQYSKSAWNHVLISRDSANTSVMYFDGNYIQQATTNSSASLDGTLYVGSLGTAFGDPYMFPGLLANAQIGTGTLTPDQAFHKYSLGVEYDTYANQESAVKSTILRAYDLNADPFVDAAASGYDLTKTGSPTLSARAIAPTVSETVISSRVSGMRSTLWLRNVGGAVATLSVDWGDGHTDSLTPGLYGSVVSRLYATPGVRTVSATATNAGGSQTITQSVGVSNLVIADNDFGSDCENPLQLAEQWALQSAGEVNILVVANDENDASALQTSQSRDFYGHSSVPVGRYIGTLFAPTNPGGFTPFPNTFPGPYPDSFGGDGANIPDAVALMRTALNAAAAKSVTIYCAGPLSNISALLDSAANYGGDGLGTGLSLATAKCLKMVVMGGNIPSGSGEYNFVTDKASTYNAITNWPRPIVFLDFYFGTLIQVGASLWGGSIPADDLSLYCLFTEQGTNGSREAWDTMAFLYAVRGDTDPAAGTNYYKVHGPGLNTITLATGANSYALSGTDTGIIDYADGTGNHYYLQRGQATLNQIRDDINALIAAAAIAA